MATSTLSFNDIDANFPGAARCFLVRGVVSPPISKALAFDSLKCECRALGIAVLAAQMGYLPGTIWILAGVVFAGAVQDMTVLFLSTRRD